MTPGAARWKLAEQALLCLAIDGAGLGGLRLRARASPLRDRFLAAVQRLGLPIRRLAPEMSDEALFGGVDVAATLAHGSLIETSGALDHQGLLILPMAERARHGLAARLAHALDDRDCLSLLALDEGSEDEALAPALTDRLGLQIDLEGVAWADTYEITFDPTRLDAVRAAETSVPDTAIEALAVTATALGVTSLRAPLLALSAARALARWEGGTEVDEAALSAATALVLAPRATSLPAPPPVEEEPPDKPPDSEPDRQNRDDSMPDASIPAEMLLEAARAVLPPDLLDRLATQRAVRAAQAGSGAGDRRRGNARGRPLPSRPGQPDGRSRIDLIATLRAAAPWQKLRAQNRPEHSGLHIARSDIQLRQFEERNDRAVIFVVDASGSAALARLAEAKGAVELLLAQAYARRDHVALIAFRGTDADLLLPPTRSLVQTKRRLASLPGGGGTPLAAGLRDALDLSLKLRARGFTPALALLTDGRANVTLDGTGGRAEAAAEAANFARLIHAAQIPSLVIDTGLRPTRGLDGLALDMGAGYLPLPRADAQGLSRAVSESLGA
ncbi:MAG: magnesium chelatase subunit D [Pseudomonadota bacterium]